MKNIHTLIADIYETVQTDGWFEADLFRDFHTKLSQSINPQSRVPGLRLSQMGKKCPCQLWHSVHSMELAEPLPSWAKIKYAYGHILEAYLIALAKASGHEVTGEQDELVLDGIVGHRDCVIDGCIVDVKSTSSRGFQKFRDGSIKNDDAFGYLDQLDGYVTASVLDPLVRVKDRGYLLAIDKSLGHLALYEHHVRPDHIRQRIADYKRIISSPQPPDCQCGTIPDGKSGNIRLDVRASYSPQKWLCRPSLRAFLYSDGIRYLTRVVREPDVPEINRDGKRIR